MKINIFLNNQQAKRRNKKENQKTLEMNKNKNTTNQNAWNEPTGCLQGTLQL